MLTGKELGAAIESALEKNGKTKADAARYFNVKAPSVSGWIKTGRISKANFDKLRVWLSQTPPSHWGAESPPLSSASEESAAQQIGYLLPEEIFELLKLYANCDAHGRTYVLSTARAQASESSAANNVSGTTNNRKNRA